MLYETHKKFGQVAGIITMPTVLSTGIVDTDTLGGGVIGLGIYVVTAYFGSVFGAQFPDIDSATSKPSKKHPVLRSIFKKCGIKHRGKFSHDFLSQAILWTVIFTLLSTLSNTLDTTFTSFLIGIAQVYTVFTAVGVFSHLFADALTAEGAWFAWCIRVKLSPVFLRKVRFFSWKPFKKWFTTDSAWNTFNYRVMLFILPIATVITAGSLLGKY